MIRGLLTGVLGQVADLVVDLAGFLAPDGASGVSGAGGEGGSYSPGGWVPPEFPPVSPRPEPVDGASVAGRVWSAAFADQVRVGDWVALRGEQFGREELGVRALRVCQRRVVEHALPFGGGCVSGLVLLVEDVDSGEVLGLPVGREQGLRVCVVAPDGVSAGWDGGERRAP